MFDDELPFDFANANCLPHNHHYPTLSSTNYGPAPLQIHDNEPDINYILASPPHAPGPGASMENRPHHSTVTFAPPPPPPPPPIIITKEGHTSSLSKLVCSYPTCSGISFGRLMDLKRHHESFHTNAVLWCPAFDCPRNAMYGDDPFPRIRRDKLMDHIRKVHKSDAERRCWPDWFEQMKATKSARLKAGW